MKVVSTSCSWEHTASSAQVARKREPGVSHLGFLLLLLGSDTCHFPSHFFGLHSALGLRRASSTGPEGDNWYGDSCNLSLELLILHIAYLLNLALMYLFLFMYVCVNCFKTDIFMKRACGKWLTEIFFLGKLNLFIILLFLLHVTVLFEDNSLSCWEFTSTGDYACKFSHLPELFHQKPIIKLLRVITTIYIHHGS